MKRSVILTDRLGPDILIVLTMKRQVLHRERANLKVPGCSNARAHDAKLVFSLLTLARYRDLSDLLRSPIVSHVPPQMSCIAITCTLCNKLYIGETGRRLGDRFREHLRDVEKNDKDASKPVSRHFNLPNHSIQHMAICGLSLHLGTTESRKNLEQKFIFNRHP